MPTAPELVHVAPATLTIGTNVRRDPHADTLVSSIKSNGVLLPIRARRTDDGLEVIDGQRRTLAAIAADLDTVPVLVVDGTTDRDRVLEQYVANEHREDLTDVERVQAFHTLSGLGYAAGTIAKRTGVTKTRVERALTITDSALELVPNGTLEDLADLAALEGQPEHDEAARILAEGNQSYFQSIIRRAAARRACETTTARIRADFPAVVILDQEPAYGDKQHVRIGSYWGAPELEHEDGTPVPSTLVSIEQAIEHLGVALAVWVAPRPGYGDSLTEIYSYVDTKQLKAAGLRKVKKTDGPTKTAEEREAEEAARELSKQWAATAEERKAFLARLMQEKQPPASWGVVAVTDSLTGTGDMRYSDTKQEALRQLLGFDHLDLDIEDGPDGEDVLLAEILGRPDRIPFALVAIALVHIEEDTQVRDAGWKPFATHGHLGAATPAYLEQLERWGYDPAEERRIIAEATA